MKLGVGFFLKGNAHHRTKDWKKWMQLRVEIFNLIQNAFEDVHKASAGKDGAPIDIAALSQHLLKAAAEAPDHDNPDHEKQKAELIGHGDIMESLRKFQQARASIA